MITKMKKLLFLIYHQEYELFLSQIRELGVIHVQQNQAGEMNSGLQELLKRRQVFKEQLKEMSFKVTAQKERNEVFRELTADQIMQDFTERTACIQNLNQKLLGIEKNKGEMEIWGDFDWQNIHRLADAGWQVKFYSCAEREYDPAWEEKYQLVPIRKHLGHVYFIIIAKAINHFPIEPMRLPLVSLSDLKKQREDSLLFLDKAKEELSAFCDKYYHTLEQYLKELEGDIDLVKVRLGGQAGADGSVYVMEGWIPVDCEEKVTHFLDESNVYYEIRDIQRSDNPPIKLKNNWFVKSYEVLTGMYGMPAYSEFDPTPLIAPFFSLFFAFCLGDAGYGIVLIILGLLLKKKIPSMRGMMNLVISLGAFTLFFGTILGTFFGINLYEATWIPEGMKTFMISGKVPGTNYDAQMLLALIIGVVHTIIAMLIKALVATSRYGFKNSLSEWGWFLVVGTFPILGTIMFLKWLPENISTWAFIVIGGVAAIGIYLLNNLKRNVLMNVGAGLWATYNMASGLLGDILSYMRLYALGLAGGMLGSVFNQLAFMAQDAAGGIPGWLVCCLILLFGHTLNIAMSCISAFVHPLRLNFVEYFKNSGYEGSGVLYNPFTTIDNK